MDSTKPKILFINYEFPPLGGGGGRANAHIAKHLVSLGHDVVLMTSRFGDLPHTQQWQGVHVIRIPTLRRSQEKCGVFEMLIFLIMSLFYAVAIFRRERPKVVVSFFSIPCGPAALLLHWLFRVPYIVALRGGDVPGFLPEQLSIYHKLTAGLTHLIWRYAAAVTANSDGLAHLAKTFSPPTQVSVIPNGVEEEFFYDRPRSPLAPLIKGGAEGGGIERTDAKSGQLKVITVGRLSEQKKIERQITVFGRLQKQNTNFTITIVGDGPDRKKLEKLATDLKVLNVSVFFVGWCERAALLQAYQAADVFLLSSDFEGMPNVILEAMAASLAIVATRAPGTVELVQNGVNGHLVDGDCLEDFDRILIALQKSQEELSRLQKASFAMAKKYTWQRVAEMYSDLVQKVVA